MAAADVVSSRRSSRAAALVRLLRPHQWVKNLLVFVPVVLDHKLFHGPTMAKAGLAFVAFCCAASSAYILNDVLDLEADRRHPTKRYRPFAAGTLQPAVGLALVPVLLAFAVAITWGSLPKTFVALLALYVVLTSAYSLYLKRIAVL